MALQATEDVFPVIVKGMEKNLKWHWSKSVKQLTENVKAMLEEMEPGLYTQCLLRLKSRESVAQQEEEKREKKWEIIELAAAKNQFLQQPRCICVSSFWRNKLLRTFDDSWYLDMCFFNAMVGHIL